MKNRTRAAVALLLMLSVVQGCAAPTPTQRLASAQAAVTLAQDSFTAAVEAKLITGRPALLTGQAVLNNASTLLNRAQAATTQPAFQGLGFWLDSVERATEDARRVVSQLIAERKGK